jgi:hypothetical protein
MPGDPHSGSKVWKAPDREIGKPGENRGKVIAHRDLQPTAAFHDRENRCNLRSRLWAADVQPILSTKFGSLVLLSTVLSTLEHGPYHSFILCKLSHFFLGGTGIPRGKEHI